jgi:hypothetical protein
MCRECDVARAWHSYLAVPRGHLREVVFAIRSWDAPAWKGRAAADGADLGGTLQFT